jgi:hypothetical protein
VASREDRERAQLAALKQKYEPAPKPKPRRRADVDDDEAGEVMVFTGRKATRFMDSLVGNVRDALLGDDDEDDDEDQDDDEDDDEDQDDDDDQDGQQDAPPPQHGFYRRKTRR